MKKTKRYIALFLLSVFSFASLPGYLWHNALSNHIDTEENYCDFYHKDLGTHLETRHISCDIFKTQTPFYDVLKVENTFSVFRTIISQYVISDIAADFSFLEIRLPTRAPPIA